MGSKLLAGESSLEQQINKCQGGSKSLDKRKAGGCLVLAVTGCRGLEAGLENF